MKNVRVTEKDTTLVNSAKAELSAHMETVRADYMEKILNAVLLPPLTIADRSTSGTDLPARA